MAEEAADVDAVAVSLPYQEDIVKQKALANEDDERPSQPSSPASAQAKQQDIALVNGQNVPNAACRLEGIFEPRPSTSSTPSPRAAPNKRSMSLAVDSSSERRQRLALMPRTTQYEKHSLLQDRSGDGLTELEAFLMEKEQPPPSSLALVPRGAHYETHALLVKKSSGLTELEHYLQEKEAEMANPTPEHRRHSDPAARQRLEPRTSQYQAHALLESKDEEGLTLIDHLLNSEDDDDDKGKCSLRCTCKNAHCANCKNEGNSSGAGSPRDQACNPGLDSPLASTKHAHFDGKKDCKETSNTQSNVKSSAADGKCWKVSNAKKKQQKDAGAAVNSACNDVAKVKKSDSHKRSCAIS